MANYIIAADVRDELLAGLVTATDLAEANAFLWDEAKRHGARFISMPPTFSVLRLGIAKCCEIVAQRKTTLSPKTMLSGDGLDAFELKRRAYRDEARQLCLILKKSDFENAEEADNPTINLYRA